MRLRLFSDLHLDFADFTPPQADADVVILAGDIHNGTRALPWIVRHFPDQPVLYVLGNHEYYSETFPDLLDTMIREAPANVTIMENTAVEVGGYRFLGCTLWTDFRLYGAEDEAWAMADAAQMMSDYRAIQTPGAYLSLLKVHHTQQAHEHSVAWLRAALEGRDNRKTIVVTHHAPSRKSLPEYGDRLTNLNPAHASNLDALIEKHRPLAWIHGHTHEVRDYQIGQTRILSNPGGYRPHERTGFDEKGTVQIEEPAPTVDPPDYLRETVVYRNRRGEIVSEATYRRLKRLERIGARPEDGPAVYVGAMVRDYRQRASLSLEETARQAGIRPDELARIEAGEDGTISALFAFLAGFQIAHRLDDVFEEFQRPIEELIEERHLMREEIEQIVSTDPDALGGAPVFRGTRVPVAVLFENLAAGLSLDDILEAYPSIPREIAQAALLHAQTLLRPV